MFHHSMLCLYGRTTPSCPNGRSAWIIMRCDPDATGKVSVFYSFNYPTDTTQSPFSEMKLFDCNMWFYRKGN
jgi:hypothetical protein